MFCWAILSLVSLFVQACLSENVKSTHELKLLLQTEIEFARELRNYAELTGSPQLKSYCDKHYPLRHRLFGSGTPSAELPLTDEVLSDYISHPINALGVVKRTTIGPLSQGGMLINIINTPVKNRKREDLRLKLIQHLDSFGQPEDFLDACSAIAFLQDAYNLKTRDLALSGTVRARGGSGEGFLEYPSDYKMSHEDMHFVGVAPSNLQRSSSSSAADLRMFRIAGEWLRTALDQWPVGKPTAYEFGDVVSDLKNIETALEAKSKSFPDGVDARQFVPLYSPWGHNTTIDNFNSMCSNGSEGWRNPSMDRHYSCRYEDHGDPFLRLAPLKLEEMHDEPLIVVFRDFLVRREYEALKKVTLQTSTYGDTPWKKRGRDRMLARTSKQHWVADRKFFYPVTESFKGIDSDGSGLFLMDEVMTEIPHPVGEASKHHMQITSKSLAGVTKRIGLATRMRVDYPLSAEPYQVVNYGLGGRYTPHFDSGGWDERPVPEEMKVYINQAKGERIGTFMAYLSDVDVGGGTVFPLLGLRSPAIEGDAIFWLNTNSDGSTDNLTRHGGCPVLVGSKWITNKWVGYLDQGLENYPCGLKEKQRFKAFVDWKRR